MKPSPLILVTAVVFVGTIGVLGVAIERQKSPTFPETFKGPPALATCFHEGSPERKELDVWTYEGHAKWQEARAATGANSPGTFAFSFPPGRPEYTVPDLGYCFYVRPGAQDAPPVKCRAGELRITALESARLLSGSYSFELENGQRRTLRFSAPYCQ